MKFLVLCAVLFGSLINSSWVWASTVSYNVSCAGSLGTMKFRYNKSAGTITFYDIRAFRRAQIIKSNSFRARTADFSNAQKIDFKYNWYYGTARYSFLISPAFEVSDKHRLVFNGDDSDGSIFNDKILNCTSRRVL